MMPGPYVHDIDPIIGSLGGVHLWWYGMGFSLGFLNAHLFLRRRRQDLGLSLRSVYDLSLLLAGGVLLGGRLVEVVFYEWPFYREHLRLISALWIGGMATHGLLFGALFGIGLFCRLCGESFLRITDALAIPGAFILGMGRIGNFIDGQIVGSLTDVAWAVKFPDAQGFRHPVVLYDGAKNFLIIPILLYVERRNPSRGVLTGTFLFIYAFLRIFIDVFREYPTTLLGLATGQALNLFLTALGLVLMIVPNRIGRGRSDQSSARAARIPNASTAGVGWRRYAFAALLLCSLVIPSDWTQDVPARYSKRHPGLEHSFLYPKLDATPPGVRSGRFSGEAASQPPIEK